MESEDSLFDTTVPGDLIEVVEFSSLPGFFRPPGENGVWLLDRRIVPDRREYVPKKKELVKRKGYRRESDRDMVAYVEEQLRRIRTIRR